MVLKGATLVTVTRGTIPNGTIVLRDGKIAAIGANVATPAGAEVIDVTGKFISPGIIDCHSHIANDDINEGGTTVSSMTGTRDVLDPTDINIYRDLAGALYIGFALLNWSAKGALLGGIYGRPIALANFGHFAIGGIVLVKLLFSGHTDAGLAAGAAAYTVFAAWFGYVLFGPGPQAS